MMGLVVGRNASNLDRLRQKYGVKIVRPDWGNFHINKEGPAEMVSAAKKDIEDSLPRTINFVIEKKYIGLLIGTKGETITGLRRTNQVKINVGEEGNVSILGNKCGCESAKSAIESLMESNKKIAEFDEEISDSKLVSQQAESESRLPTTSFCIDKFYNGLVIGLKGEGIRSLEKEHNVQIDINDEGVVAVCGEKSSCEAAKQAIETLIECKKPVRAIDEGNSDPKMVSSTKRGIEGTRQRMSFCIEQNYNALVIGHKGENIHALETEHDVEISIKDDGEVVVRGQTSNFESVKNAIEAMIEKWEVEDVYQEKFSVPADRIGFVVGKGGANKNRIESTYGVRVYLPAKDGSSDEVVVKGSSADQVSAAVKDIQERFPDWTMSFPANDSLFGRMVGRGGEPVRRLEKKLRVTISVEDGNVYITGFKDRIEAAKDAIIADEQLELFN